MDEHHVTTHIALEDFLELLQEWAAEDRWISFDLETRSDKNNLEEWHESSRIVSASFSPSPTEAWVVPLSHPSAPWAGEWVDVAKHLFYFLKGQLIAQNGKFDVRWIRHHTGLDLSPFLAWDTMDASYILDENQPKGLKVRAVEDAGVAPWGDIDLSDAEQVEWDELAHYNALDTANTFALFEWQRDRLRETPRLAYVFWRIQMPAVRALSRVEGNGMLLDIEETERRRREAEDEHARLNAALLARVPEHLLEKPEGVAKSAKWPSWSPNSLFFKRYAEERWPILECSDSCEECGRGKKPHPQPSWAKSVLKRLSPEHEDAKLLLEFRKWDTQLKTYLRRWPKDVTESSRLHATYKTTSTVTGRLSCERPNLQNVDRKLKTCFEAPPGFRFVQVDYSQIELRIAAHVSGDENLIQAYLDGQDIHTLTAARVLDKDPEEVTEDERYKAKATNFGFLYGQLAPGFVVYARDVYDVIFTKKEAEETRSRFFEAYPGLVEYHNTQRRAVRKHQQVENIFGRVRRLPGIDSNNILDRWAAERQAINAPIQSAASDLLLLSLARLNDELDPPQARVVGTVHDSILLEVRDDVLDPVVQTVGRVMTTPEELWSGLRLTIPLQVEFEVGSRWGDPEKTTYVMEGAA